MTFYVFLSCCTRYPEQWPQPKSKLVHFNLKLTSDGNNFNDFLENQPISFMG